MLSASISRVKQTAHLAPWGQGTGLLIMCDSNVRRSTARDAQHHPAVFPPSTVQAVPVVKLAPSPARKATTAAMSEGAPRRPRGMAATSAARAELGSP